MEALYLAIFTGEMVIRVMAYGLVLTEHAYLRDPWCQLDFTVVTLAWLPLLLPSLGNYSMIRSIRALRPLRALKIVPGMPTLINAMTIAVPKLGNVLLLGGFVFLVFGIIGVELPPPTSHLLPSYLLPPTSHLLPPTSYLPPRTSYLPPPTSYLPTSYLLPPTSYLPTSYLRTSHLPTSHLPTSYLLPPTSHLVRPT